jgi:hypothetical protein
MGSTRSPYEESKLFPLLALCKFRNNMNNKGEFQDQGDNVKI